MKLCYKLNANKRDNSEETIIILGENKIPSQLEEDQK